MIVGSVSLVAMASCAFAADGPLHHALQGRYGPGLPHRKEQERAAIRLAEHIERGRDAGQCLVALNQIAAGVGKTLVAGVVCALSVALHRRRAVIATFTRELRGELASPVTAGIVGEVVCRTAAHFHLAAPNGSIRIAERRGLTSFASPSKVDMLRRRRERGFLGEGDVAAVNHYIDWFDGGGRDLSAYFQLPEANGSLPLGMTELQLCLTPREHGTAEYQAARAEIDDANEADIILVTHRMLLLNSKTGGNLLLTRDIDAAPAGFRKFGPLVIDEADRLPAAAAGIGSTKLTLADIGDTLSHLRARTPGQMSPKASEAFANACEALARLRNFLLDSPLSLQRPSRVYRAGGDTLDALVKRLFGLAQALRLLANALNAAEDITSDILRMTSAELVALSDLPELTREHPDAAVIVVDYDEGRFDIALRSRTTRFLCRSLWSGDLHSFQSVFVMSATLRGSSRDWTPFQDAVALSGVKEPGRISIHADIAATGFGKVEPIVFIARLPKYLPTDHDELDFMNRAHLEAVAKAVCHIDRTKTAPADRTLVLCQSYAARDDLFHRLRLYGVSDEKLILQSRKQNVQAMIGRYAQTPNSIWLGTNWFGINLVHPRTGATLPKTIVIPRMPVPPVDAGQQEPYGLRASIDEAHRKMTQGIARGLRRASDCVELWILDGRFPLPEAYRQQIGTPRDATDGRNPFARFADYNDGVIRTLRATRRQGYAIYDPDLDEVIHRRSA